MRFYLAGIGRFIAKDLLFYSNRYRAFGDSPPKQVDPLGLQDVDTGQKDTQPSDQAQQSAGQGHQTDPRLEPEKRYIRRDVLERLEKGEEVVTDPSKRKKPYEPVKPAQKTGYKNWPTDPKTGKPIQPPPWWRDPTKKNDQEVTWEDIAKRKMQVLIKVIDPKANGSYSRGACTIEAEIDIPSARAKNQRPAAADQMRNFPGEWEIWHENGPVMSQELPKAGFGAGRKQKSHSLSFSRTPTPGEVGIGGVTGDFVLMEDKGIAPVKSETGVVRTGKWQVKVKINGKYVKSSKIVTITK